MFMMVFLQATVGMTFVCQSEMSWQLLDGLPWNGMHTTMHPSSWMSSRSSDFPSDALIYRSWPTMFTSHTHFWPSLDFFYKRKRNKEKKSGIKKCQYLPLQHKATSQRLDQIKTVSVLSNELFCDFRQVCLQWWWLSPGQSEDGSSVLLLARSRLPFPLHLHCGIMVRLCTASRPTRLLENTNILNAEFHQIHHQTSSLPTFLALNPRVTRRGTSCKYEWQVFIQEVSQGNVEK